MPEGAGEAWVSLGGNTAIIVLFGVACPAPCPVSEGGLLEVKRKVAGILRSRGFAIRPPPARAVRPTTEEAPLEDRDPAERVEADRVVVVDLERGAARMWVTHYVKGVVAPWAVHTVGCTVTEGRLSCPQLETGLVQGLRPRRAQDVDLVGGLRSRARAISQCVQIEDRRPIALRFFGRVDLMLEAHPDGSVRVTSVAPSRVARARLGACLRQAIEALNVGPFTGEPMKMRIPVQL